MYIISNECKYLLAMKFSIYIWIESFFNMVSLCVIWQYLWECLVFTKLAQQWLKLLKTSFLILYCMYLNCWECIKMVIYDSWISLSLTLHAFMFICCCCVCRTKRRWRFYSRFSPHYYYADVNNSCVVWIFLNSLLNEEELLKVCLLKITQLTPRVDIISIISHQTTPHFI